MSLHDLQTKVHVAKDKKNDFGGYNYRTAEGILAAAKAALPEGAWIKVSDEMSDVAGHIFVKATATVWFPDDGEYSACGYAMHPLTKKGMDPSQITGSASSYARKYALGGLLALDDGSVDPDGSREPYQPETGGMATSAIARIMDCPTIEALQAVWTSLPRDVQADSAVIDAKDKMKASLPNG